MGYHPLVDFHFFSLTKLFPITPSAIQPIGISSTFCINKTVPGFLDVILFQSLDVGIFVVQQLNSEQVMQTPENCAQKISLSVCIEFARILYAWDLLDRQTSGQGTTWYAQEYQGHRLTNKQTSRKNTKFLILSEHI